ncbi:unnamed protein product [Closterium sp. NIES-65]|nr:unnamed protein product [Closterium sp. NIES-65]
MYGHVAALAEEIKKGAESVEGVEVSIFQVPETLSDDVLAKMHAPPKPDIPSIDVHNLPEADCFLFGFPTRYGMMSAQMKAFFDATGSLWRTQALAGKPAGFFFSTGSQGGGQETTALTAVTQLTHHGMLFVPIGYTYGANMFVLDEVKGGSPYGAGTLAGDGTRQPTQIELEQAFYQGQYTTKIAKKLKKDHIQQVRGRLGAQRWRGGGRDRAVTACLYLDFLPLSPVSLSPPPPLPPLHQTIFNKFVGGSARSDGVVVDETELPNLNKFVGGSARSDGVVTIFNKFVGDSARSDGVVTIFNKFVGGSARSDGVVVDEAELQRHQQLERLYNTTKSAKHFQREMVKGIEGIINANLKHIESIAKLSEECRKYGAPESPGGSTVLGRAALHFGAAHSAIEKERDNMDRTLGTQVGDPLKAMVTGAPLEDARSLTHRYDKLRQEAEGLVVEIQKRNQKARDGLSNPENAAKLQQAEQKMGELAATMTVLGREAATAMMAVEAQQQRQTLQRLIGMVEAERAFHQRSVEILNHLHAQMMGERQKNDHSGSNSSAAGATPAGAGSTNPFAGSADPPPPSYEEVRGGGGSTGGGSNRAGYFLAEVVHAFDAEGPGEMSLNVGDYVVVRQVSPNGWSEGEAKGKAGWFPSAFVERRQRAPASKILEASGGL